MKKEIKVVAIVLAALVFFLGGVVVGTTNGINVNVNMPEGSATPVVQQTQAPATTQAPTTQAPATTQAPTTQAPQGGDTTTTQAPQGGDTTTAAPQGGSSSVPSTKAEVAAAYNKAINDLRAYQGKVTLKKHDIIQVGLADGPAASVLNPVIAKLTATEPYEWTFENGVDVADPNRKLVEKIIPYNRDANVQDAGLVSGSATANADGGYTMTMTFVAEDSIFDGEKNTSEPTYHMGAMDPLNLGSLDLGDAIKITEATLHYPGASITATVDGQGRIVKIEQKLPLNGTGKGKAAVVPVTLELSGSMDGNYEFIYG